MTDLPTRIPVGLVSVGFTLFDKQMPADFPLASESAGRLYADVLKPYFDLVYSGLLSSEGDASQAAGDFAQHRLDALVFAPAMAAPPSYACRSSIE